MTNNIIEQLKKIEPMLDPPVLGSDLTQQIFDANPDGIVIVDGNGKIQYVNRQALLIFGYQFRDLYNQPVEALLPDSMKERHTAHRQAYQDDPRTRPMGLGLSLIATSKHGRELPVEINLSPLTTPNGTFVAAFIRRSRI